MSAKVDESLNKTLSEREKTHGSYKSVALAYDNLKFALGVNSDKYSKEHKLALDMIAQKLARIACGNAEFGDHWHDIAGYATLAEKHCKGE